MAYPNCPTQENQIERLGVAARGKEPDGRRGVSCPGTRDENDRRSRPRVVPDVDPVLVTPHNGLLVGHHSLRTECHLARDFPDERRPRSPTLPRPSEHALHSGRMPVSRRSLEKTGRSAGRVLGRAPRPTPHGVSCRRRPIRASMSALGH